MISTKIFIELLKKWIQFVDRKQELNQLTDLAFKGYPFPIAIYGPEGCGKTTLLKVLIEHISRYSDVVALYVDALEEKELNRAILAPSTSIWSILESFSSLIPIGVNLAKNIMSLIRLIYERISLKNKKLVIVVDDVYRAIGFEDVDRYTKMLYEWIGYLHQKYDIESVCIVLTTSEGVSKRILSRHTYVHIYMIWNLPRKGFEELVQQLEVPSSVGVDELWYLTGGNPRALIEIAALRWNVKKWCSYLFERRVLPSIEDLDKDRLRRLVEDPDSDWSLARELENRGLMIELTRSLAIGYIPREDVDLGIGSRWAWQLPIYRKLVMDWLSS